MFEQCRVVGESWEVRDSLFGWIFGVERLIDGDKSLLISFPYCLLLIA